MVASGQMQGFISNPIFQVDDDADLSDDDELPAGMVDDPRCPAILLSKEEKRRLRQPWKHALIIKMFNGKVGYMSLMKRLKRKWELKGGVTLTDIGHEFFIARFSCLDDYNHVLSQGPWMLDDNYLTIRKWVPNFIPTDQPMRFLTAWVRIPHLSVEYFDQEFLEKIGNKIGKVTRIDQNTVLAQRGQFTRLSVEIDLEKPLLSKFWFKGKVWRIQYEGLRMICFKCGKIGHQEEQCTNLHHDHPLPDPMELREDGDPKPSSPLSTNLANDFGSWMMVKKPPPRRRGPRVEKIPMDNNRPVAGKKSYVPMNGDAISGKAGGSRFEILEEDNQPMEPGKAPAEDAKSSLEDSILAGEAIDLGKSSQNLTQNLSTNPFNLGLSNPPPLEGSFLGKAKSKNLRKKKSNPAPTTILKNITNNATLVPILPSGPIVSLGKENNTAPFQANTEANPSLPLPRITHDHHESSLDTNSDPATGSTGTDLSLNPPGEDSRGHCTNGGTLFWNNRPPESQTGVGDSLMDDSLLGESRTPNHVETTQ
ncbi:uncharacterized protein LOC125494935 [Beta vulgaris subsp. vulgaris]|uniref:uncharacterized protein LOC125494935 n=1 Tax=Beta vulgaris subsp. vulgaris TaxID=3555 RepID=UPI00203698EC|nr:uncharacterized protein LOC125494935 [Beta vulgaris subsp. vulgaris]